MESVSPKPFVKWAGGKSQLLKQFNEYFPARFNNYIEPFVGGGAVFFHLFNAGRLDKRLKAILIDANEELINTFNVIRNNSRTLINILKNNDYIPKKEIFLTIRKEIPIDPIERAARIIYLNKTCYNGLYRVNRNNEFNAPFGYYKNPTICDAPNLRAVSNALKYAKIIEGDFSICLKYAKKEDFIYFDPPYQPISSTSSFTNYTKYSFSFDEQQKLASVFRILADAGCYVMLSNSDNSEIRKLYKKYNISNVKARRQINCKANGRGAIGELVITNYRSK